VLHHRNGPSAAACMTITHYPELVHSKKVVLTRGDLLDPKQVSAQEVRSLLLVVLVPSKFKRGE